MKVLFISDNFPPEVNAPSIRTFEHCKKWSSLGDDVTVITCFPNFPKGVIFNGYTNKFSENSVIENINVTRVWSYIAKNEGFIKRVFDYISFSITSFISAMFKDFDIVISTSPQFFTSFTGYFIKIIKKKKWIFEVRDLWPDTIAAVGAIKRDSILYRILEKIELALYKRADLVVVVTKSFKENLIERGIDENKIKIVYNGIDKSFVEKNLIKTRIEVRNELNLNNKKIIGYIGTIGMTHDLISIVKECRKLPDEYHLLIISEVLLKINY